MRHTSFQDLALENLGHDGPPRRGRHLRVTAVGLSVALVFLAVTAGLLARAVSSVHDVAELASVKHLALWTVTSLVVVIGFAACQLLWQRRARSTYESQVATQASILNAVIDEIPESVAIWDRDFRYRFVNKAFERWAQKSRSEFVGRTIAQVFGDEVLAQLRPMLLAALRGEHVQFEREFPNGPMRFIRSDFSPLTLPDGTIAGVIAMAHDVTAHHDERARLERLTNRDALTGLMSRAAFEGWLDEACSESDGRDVAVLYIDLDRFKPVNDEFGHGVGDAVLKEFARRARGAVRPADAVARLGGDEFAIGLKGVRVLLDAQNVAAKIVSEAQRPMVVGHRLIVIGASVGVAADATQEHDGWRGLVVRADEMLYRSKRGGRSRFTVHSAAAG